MIVSIHQPAYLPWLGYFDRIAKSDAFILLDNVQFERNSFTNRNRIKTASGPVWLTVPVRLDAHFHKTIVEIEIDARQNWRRKHLRSIEQSYAKAPGFNTKMQRLRTIYQDKTNRLAELCGSQLAFWLAELGIGTPVLRGSELPVAGHKSALVLNLCKHVGATKYLSGPLGRGYLDEAKFSETGIQIEYQEFDHPVYRQMHGDFVPAMGIVDFWMNRGEPGAANGRT